MAMPTVLVTQHRGGAAPGIFRLSGGTSLGSVLTSTFGVNEPAITGTPQCSANDSVEFKGDVYTVNFDSTTSLVIRKRVPGTGVISTVKNYTTGSSFVSSTQRTGLYVVNAGGGPFLVCVWGDFGLNNTKMTRSSDGTTWTDFTISGGTAIFSIVNLNVRVYRGLLLIPSGGGAATALWIVNIASASLAIIADPLPVNDGNSLCIFKNRVFHLRSSAFGGIPAVLQELSAGTLVTVATLGNGIANAGGINVSSLQSIGNTKMIAIVLDSDGGNGDIGWRAFDITVSGATITPTEITNPFIPTVLRKPSAGGSAAFRQNYGFWSWIDNETTPGTPRVYYFITSDETGTADFCEYVDSASTLLTSTTGLTPSNIAFVAGQGGGEYINTSDGDFFIDDVIIEQGTVAGRAKFKFRAYGGGGADKFVRGYFNSQENPTLAQMTLVGSVTGGSAIRNGNQLEQVTADGSQYTFEWAATVDGQTNNQPENIMLILATV